MGVILEAMNRGCSLDEARRILAEKENREREQRLLAAREESEPAATKIMLDAEAAMALLNESATLANASLSHPSAAVRRSAKFALLAIEKAEQRMADARWYFSQREFWMIDDQRLKFYSRQAAENIEKLKSGIADWEQREGGGQ